MKKTVILGCLKMLPALLILPFVFTLLRAQGSIVYVDGSYTGPEYGTAANPFNTIQEGIDYAVDGDTVLVLPGTYFEALRILNESIRLRSQAGPDATIIEPNPYDPGISVSFDKAANFAIDGFTIRHATWGIDIFFPEDKSVTARINNNILTENWGGLRLANNYSGTVYDVLITNNQIISNTTLKTYEDVGLKIASAEGSGVIALANNIIAENTGGISVDSPYSQISFAIVNNTVYGNGVGLSADAPYLNLVNNILFMNGSPPYNDLDLTQNGPSVTVASNIIGDGQFAGIDGNQAADPLLVSPAQRDFHLRSGSPAIDAGDTFSNTVDFVLVKK